MAVAAADEARVLLALHGFRRRLWLDRLTEHAWRGALIGVGLGVVAALSMAVSHRGPDYALAVAGIPLAAIVASLTWSLIRRPTLAQAARGADRRLHLREQLSTALELISSADQSPFSRVQIARAAETAERAHSNEPRPLGRWTSMLGGGVIVAIVVALVLSASAEWLDGAFRSAESPPPSPSISTEAAAAPFQTGNLQSLNKLLERDRVPDEEDLASLEQALANRTAQSRATQQALGSLADALRQISAGQATADALDSADYATAANRLAELATSSDQLSADARKLLSTALLNAANTTDSPLLADRERRAGEALKFSSYAPTAAALQNLADAINKTSQSVLSQEQLSIAWAQLQAARRDAAQSSSGGPDPQRRAQARPAGSSAEAQPAAGSTRGDANKGAAGSGDAISTFDPDQPDARLNVAGIRVEVPVQLSTAPGRLPAPASDASAPEAVQLAADSVGDATSTAQSAPPKQTPAERAAIPIDLKTVVRDYFNAGTPTR